MPIAKKSVVWGLFAAGGTVSSFLFPAGWFGKLCLFIVISLSLWHAAHRLRVVFHDFGVRRDKAVANAVYLVAFIGTVLAAFYLYKIS